MTIHCKVCNLTFDAEEYSCEEDLLCPLMQIQIIDNDDAEYEHEYDQPGQGNPAPSESLTRAVK